jgi:hypothetical protein
MPSTKADNNRVSWAYSDDSTPPEVFAVSAKAVYVLGADAAKFGGSASEAANRRIPKELKMRKVKCIAAGHPDKWVPCYSTACDLWTTPGTTVTLDLNGVDVSYASTKYKRSEKARDTTRQTA